VVIVGNVIKGFVNGVEVTSVTGDVFGVGDTNVDHGFTYFEVDTYDD
jgi:hypothetical protein